PEDRMAAITAGLPIEKQADVTKQYEPTDTRSKAAREEFTRRAELTPEESAKQKAAGVESPRSAVIPYVTPEGTLNGGYQPAAPRTTITTPEMARRQANLPAQHSLERQKLVEDYKTLQREAKETPNAVSSLAPRLAMEWATQSSFQRDPKTGMVTHQAGARTP